MKYIDDPNSLKLDFYYSVIRDILGTLDCGFSMSALILDCCCIDYMSVPLASGRKNTRKDFKKFISDYMSAANSRYTEESIQDEIYAIRCSLVHTFGETDTTSKLNIKPIFQIQSFPNHLEKHDDENGIERLYISIPHFIAEVVTGVEKFFRECTDTTLLKEWYKRLIIITGINGTLIKLGYVNNKKIIHSQIHPFISCFDSSITNYEKLASKISDAFLKKHNYWVDM